jgi:rubrerythrin
MSKTMENLAAAFAGESQAAHKYLAFARKADDEGLPQVARLFRAAAKAELVHALNHFKAMEAIKSTAENLETAIHGENYEVTSMYPPFVAEAEAAGEKRAQRTLKWAMEVEKYHESLYQDALNSLGQPQEEYEFYVCSSCGYTHPRSAPEKCPVCGAPAERFEQVH